MDQRSDLFSLGIIIYEVLTGTRPEKPYRQANNVPDEINGILGRLLVEEPSLRPTAPELYEVFSKYLEKKITIPAYEVRLPPTSFVANKEIMQKLTNIKGETVIVTGETGLGKTRLLKELKYEYLFRDYTGLFFIPGQVGYFHNAVCEFVGYHSLDFSDREDRFQIYAEITERLLEFAQGKKIFIFVDDLNDLDDYELGLFRYIGHSLENSSIAMIGSARPDPRIKDLNFFELGLKEFSAKDTQELLEKTFFKIESENGDTDSLSFSDWLHKQTGGNPLFIVEILRTLYEKRILYYQTDHWHIARDLAEHTEISNEIEGILLMRLKILNPDEIKVLKVLCIVEHPLELSVIQEIVSGAVHLDLEILKMLGLIRDEYVKGRRTLALANQIITTIMKKNIEQDEVNSIIVKTVSAIEGYSPGENEYYPLLARLCEKIGESKKAYDYLLLSAENSDKINDFEQAILFYRKIIDYSKEFEPKRVGGFALRLGDLYLASGDNDSAVNYYKKALDYSDTRTRALFGLGKAYLNAGNYDNSVNNLQCALSEIKNQQSGEYVNTTNWLAYALMYEKEFKKAESLLNQSLKKAQLIESVHLQSEALYYVATLNWFRGEFEKGKENCLELIEFCKQNNLEKQYAYAVNLLSSLYIQTNDIDNGLKYIELAISSFERLKYPNALASALNNKALLLLNSGETKVAMDIFEQSLKISLKIKNRMRESAILTCIADILERTGKFARAHEYYEKALECSPDLYYAISGLVSIYNKRGEFDKALDLLERRLKHNVEAQCLIDTGMVYSVSGDKEKAEQFIKNGLERIENENPEISVKIDAYLGASQFFYEKADFKNSLNYAAKLKKTAPNMFPESWIADVLIKINNFRLGRNKEIDIENELQELKKREFLYDYAYLRRLQIEAMIERGITTEKTKWITDELNSIEEIFNTMEAKIELGKIQEMKLRLFPLIIRDYLTRVISTQYLETFSKLAELISANLGQDDFVKNLLDLIISATNAERGAIFVSTEGKMEFVAGRNIDKRTIRDATELSMTAIEQMSKNQIVFVPNAFDDPNFNIKKSVLLNQIHSILCIPLGIGKKPIGAIYLDSRITGSMFEQKDRDFIICVAKILASVIEKSIAFKSLAQENVVLRTKIISEVGSGYLVGKSRQMKQVYKIVEDISNSNAPVLITGETGTGKGMLARLIHLKSRRRENKFLSINCGAIPETLLESELFGYKKGAFTGA
ncbi:MAG: sigma 54-interacting transcriptional regulator, partial [candidate division WOR-3 bacterium]